MNNKILDKYKVVLYPFENNEKIYIVEATDCDDAIKRTCIIEGIKYNPKNQPSCMVQRLD